MTNGSNNNLISNNEGRGNGDDAFALFSANDAGGGANTGNVFENLSATVTWRAAGVAVYGGHSNTFRNLYIADMLTYSGVTISSLDFGYQFVGFGPQLTTFEHLAVRAGGTLGQQTFGAIGVLRFQDFRGIRFRTGLAIRRTPDHVQTQKPAPRRRTGPGHGLHQHPISVRKDRTPSPKSGFVIGQRAAGAVMPGGGSATFTTPVQHFQKSRTPRPRSPDHH